MKLNYTFPILLVTGCLSLSGAVPGFAIDPGMNGIITLAEDILTDENGGGDETEDDSSSEDSEEETEPREWTGDVYRIAADELDDTMALIKTIGGKVLFNRDDLYLILYPADARMPEDVESGRRIRPVKGKRYNLPPISLPKKKAVPAMENARFAFDAQMIHSGEGLPGSFDGTGVVVGFSDVGFDACHSNFLNADGSESRVRKFVHYEVTEGRVDVLSTPEEIAEYRTDLESYTHATHVAGILAGRGGGGKYIGMAPGADIVATTSDLYDVGILAGVEEIIAYAKSVGKPAVVNISIGSYGGPHDGSSLFCQYLDKCAEDAIICISTGNEGENTNHVAHTFASDTEKIFVRFQDTNYDFFNVEGSSDAYSEDDSPVKRNLYIYDTVGKKTIFETPMIDFTEDPEWVLTSDKELAEQDPRYHYDETYATYFDGEFYMIGGIDPNNGRFCAKMIYSASTDIKVSDSKPWARYQVGSYFQGVGGKRVDIFADGVRSRFISNMGKRPDSDMSVSDLATGHNVIPVGAYWTSTGITMNNGGVWGGGTPFTVCGFTSYGTLTDGRVTPMTVAPGSPIVSSYSGVYTDIFGTGYCAYEHEGYHWGLNGGTSMSTPYVAGSIATWLQANPMLTSKEVQDLVIESNNTEDYPLSANPRHGRGVFDPYKGLKILMDRGYTDVQTVLSRSLFASYSGGNLKINNPDGRQLRIDIYSIDGRLVSSLRPGDDDIIVISAQDLGLPVGGGMFVSRITAAGATPEIVKISI